MKTIFRLLYGTSIFLLLASPALAVGTDISNYTNNTLQLITLVASSGTVFFLIKGGYCYITSTGKPEMLDEAKKTIRNALIGLILVLTSVVVMSILQHSIGPVSTDNTPSTISFAPIKIQHPNDGLTQVLIDAVTGFIQNIVESSTQPVINAIIEYLTTTPELLTNSVVLKFWLTTVGITDSLFVLVVASLGLHFMSASHFGFEEIELKQILPRIALAFLGANTSLFLANYVIITSNAFVAEVLKTTGGLTHAWILNTINPSIIITNTTPLVTLIFLLLFLIISIVLLFMYIVRLITVSIGAVLAPFIFLLWAIPKFSDFAEIAIKTYIVSVFMIFIHVVVIQLASSFLAFSDTSTNSVLSIAIAIGLFLTLLRIQPLLLQMMFYTSRNGAFSKVGGQIMNILTKENRPSNLQQINFTAIKTRTRN